MADQFFIAGTDTDVGKTLVSLALLQAAKSRGLATLALKPVAAGCEQTRQGLRNSDALSLQQMATVALCYEQVNPLAFLPPVAPHIAAEQHNQRVDLSGLVATCRAALNTPADFRLLEGAGGWRVPLTDTETMADLAKALAVPVILVVGLRLGCINHALLTAEAIARDGLLLAGWVANQVDATMAVVDENVSSLRSRISAPFLGHIPFLHNSSPIDAAKYLDIGKLLD